jgi:Ca2+-binding EF-hand superfamily protein
LLNDSYRFLGVTVDPAQVAAIFKDFSKGSDSLMTYVEYFSFVERAICKPKELLAAPPKPIKAYVSRLRSFFWLLLKKLYELYDKDHNQKLDPREIETLIREVLDQTSVSELEFVLQSIFRMDTAGHIGISFEVFAPNFLRYLADLGLSKWSLQHPHG